MSPTLPNICNNFRFIFVVVALHAFRVLNLAGIVRNGTGTPFECRTENEKPEMQIIY